MTSENAARQLIRLLETERRLLLDGDLAKLAKLTRRREALLEQIRLHPPSEKSLDALHRLSGRNQKLYNAAREGIQTVRERLALVGKEVPSVIYGANGSTSSFAAPRRTLHKRA